MDGTIIVTGQLDGDLKIQSQLDGKVAIASQLGGEIVILPGQLCDPQVLTSQLNGEVVVNGQLDGEMHLFGQLSGDIDPGGHDIPPYEGDYEVVPKVDIDQTLETKNKRMTGDVLVYRIPIFEVPGPTGGTTLIIGDE